MDNIIIKDLEVYAFHGVNQQEKELGQKFLISIKIYMDLRKAVKDDDISKTVNYAELCEEVESEFKRCKYDLIETAGEKLTEFILLKYDFINGVELIIKKPWAPIGKPVSYAAVKFYRCWHEAYIGIGSNIGNKSDNINKSIEIVNNSSYCKVVDVSSYYETKPVGYLDQDNFVNCAVKIKTLLTPEELISFLMKVEKNLKRERNIRWGPRTIDLDVLLYDDVISSSREVIIPHPRMHERLFVLKPLSEIAPYVIHPILRKRIIELYDEVSKKQTLL
ncbi:dihydroneopterin aldolase/2-amino-4-hydroxy-6-hydroxymethyldihydropteridine diphosphokinase [Clostridium algifaecis]|uniref:Bifunctional folate synthesis protein n=1 Tax=Clostridium algifaecis TaxID=1472040 RepID=A0ABS4KV51_9CLOT|nr:2-amino-4-hydroxy-6-hydroxymethyldihydropteridine diphosphokinase [Clostridium algifaecis]MBP2033919.1 dihydroneopterin aldolase/2-amino-4-hydroxy-6-hydroxymethyldihydropteridine diphosphokinase [Clostridium algifaecis]